MPGAVLRGMWISKKFSLEGFCEASTSESIYQFDFPQKHPLKMLIKVRNGSLMEVEGVRCSHAETSCP